MPYPWELATEDGVVWIGSPLLPTPLVMDDVIWSKISPVHVNIYDEHAHEANKEQALSALSTLQVPLPLKCSERVQGHPLVFAMNGSLKEVDAPPFEACNARFQCSALARLVLFNCCYDL